MSGRSEYQRSYSAPQRDAGQQIDHRLIEDFRLDAAEVAERTSKNKWDNQGRWAHGILPNWLGTWAAWLEDSYLKPLPALMVKLGIQREPVEPMSWRSIAIQLSGARIHE